jgi:hypothetical protein
MCLFAGINLIVAFLGVTVFIIIMEHGRLGIQQDRAGAAQPHFITEHTERTAGFCMLLPGKQHKPNVNVAS